MNKFIEILKNILSAIKKDWFVPLFKMTVKIFFIVTMLILSRQIWEYSRYPILFNSEGMNNLLTYYSVSIKFFTALFALIAIWVTLERLSQTDRRLVQAEKQMDLISDNNRFNNFSVHKKEFITTFKKKDYIKEYEKKINASSDSILTLIYGEVYYSTYNNFEPRINSDFKKKMMNIANKSNEFVTNNQKKELIEFPLNDLQDMTSLIHFSIKNISININKIDSHQVRIKGKISLGIDGSDLDNLEKIYNECRILAITLDIYQELLLFDGTPALISAFQVIFDRINTKILSGHRF